MTKLGNAPARLVIVRHGNTFRPDETPRWVGRRTDLHLVEEERARNAARFLMRMEIVPDAIYAAPLHRTMETAKLIREEMGLTPETIPLESFSEIDYGPDENKTESEVKSRLGAVRLRETNPERAVDEALALEEGARVLDAWNRTAAVPPGWNVDVECIVRAWRELAAAIGRSETALVVSSNGIIRFAPHLLRIGYAEFCSRHKIKVSTGGVCMFENHGGGWDCAVWNSKPCESSE